VVHCLVTAISSRLLHTAVMSATASCQTLWMLTVSDSCLFFRFWLGFRVLKADVLARELVNSTGDISTAYRSRRNKLGQVVTHFFRLRNDLTGAFFFFGLDWSRAWWNLDDVQERHKAVAGRHAWMTLACWRNCYIYWFNENGRSYRL